VENVVESQIIPEGEVLEEFEWGEVIRGLVDIQAWLTGFAYLGLLVSLYSYSLFLPTIVSGLGYAGGFAQLHTAIALNGEALSSSVKKNFSFRWFLTPGNQENQRKLGNWDLSSLSVGDTANGRTRLGRRGVDKGISRIIRSYATRERLVHQLGTVILVSVLLCDASSPQGVRLQ